MGDSEYDGFGYDEGDPNGKLSYYVNKVCENWRTIYRWNNWNIDPPLPPLSQEIYVIYTRFFPSYNHKLFSIEYVYAHICSRAGGGGVRIF